MLIQSSSSSSCRGWEENDSDLTETDHKTLREYIINEILMYEWDLTREESIEKLDNDPDVCGGWEGDEDQYNWEGEEGTVTYKIFKPTQEYIDMLIRNM